jgi:asparagine synthase (glutamine-hydrolysing)
MCGIFGGVGISLKDASACIDLIKRGNDGITIEQLTNSVIFAARRHLVKNSGKENKNGKSDQPYFSNDKKISLIFNGEFYNFENYKKVLKDKKIEFSSTGDTEVFLKLYETKGINFLFDKKIDSLFSLAIYDENKKKIYITRDWPGRIPLYYYHDKDKFIFSSELKGFKGLKNFSLQKPIELEPGHYLEYDIEKKEVTKVKYFSPVYSIIKNNNDIMQIGKDLHNVLDESAKNRTMGDVPICTMLSGGIDSVLTTFYVFKNLNFKKIGYQPTSYVFSVKGFDSTDVRKARIAASGFKAINLKLIEVEADREEIVVDTPKIIETFEMRKMKALSFYPLPIYWYLAPRMHKDGFKVTIGGHGVDELLGAYDSWKELDKPHEVQIRTISRLAFINNIYNNMLKRASIIFMNRGPIEARFPFLNPKLCEFMLSIDKKWLQLTKINAEHLINLIDKKKLPSLNKIKNMLLVYLDNESDFEEKFLEKEKNDLKKIFWKFPLLVSSYMASEESFLEFDQVFNPKLRGQHGAGITSLEKDITLKYSNLGKTDSEIFQKISSNTFA